MGLRWQNRRTGAQLLSEKQQNPQLKTEHSSPKWIRNLKKDTLLQKKKRRPHQEVGGAISRYKQPHTSWGGTSTDWKLTGSQRLTYRSERSEPHIKPSRVGIRHWEKEPLEPLALKASGACVQELYRTGGNGDPILKRRTDFHMH